MKLNEYSLESPNGNTPCRDEQELFAALGLAWIPPELREDIGECELAEKGAIPELVTRSDLRGTFHCHTDWSDGGNTIEEMAEAARAAGLDYLGLADHSKTAFYANGLSIDRVRKQWTEIDALNAKYAGEFRIFKGIESDILTDGALDYPDDLLSGFDYIVASIHSGFKIGRDAMTKRMVSAVRNPFTTILGHPTGRLLLQRDAYEVDLDQVLDAAAEAGCMVEINADPHRFDLDSVWARKASARGISLPINPDAHSTGGLEYLELGVGVARRAGLTRKEVWNTLSLGEIVANLESRRFRRKSS